MQTPTLKRRLSAMTYESLLIFAVLFMADYLFDTLTQSRHALMLRNARQLWLFVILGIYFVWFWLHGGQTLPMKTWRIRLLGPQGRPLSPGRAVARYVLLWIVLLPALGLIWLAGMDRWPAFAAMLVALLLPPFYALVDRDGQFLHDRLLGTRLVTSDS